MTDSKGFPVDHPIWLIAKATILLLMATLFAYTNTSSFDETEVKFLIELGIVLFGGTAIEAFIKKTNK